MGLNLLQNILAKTCKLAGDSFDLAGDLTCVIILFYGRGCGRFGYPGGPVVDSRKPCCLIFHNLTIVLCQRFNLADI